MLFRAHGVVGYHARLAFISVETEFKFMREVLGSIPNVSIFVRFASVAFIPFFLSFVYFIQVYRFEMLQRRITCIFLTHVISNLQSLFLFLADWRAVKFKLLLILVVLVVGDPSKLATKPAGICGIIIVSFQVRCKLPIVGLHVKSSSQ